MTEQKKPPKNPQKEIEQHFDEVVAELQLHPQWPNFYNYFVHVGFLADNKAIMSTENTDVLRGKAQAFREVMHMIRKRTF